MPNRCMGHDCSCGNIVYLRYGEDGGTESECDDIEGVSPSVCTSRHLMTCPVCSPGHWTTHYYLQHFVMLRAEIVARVVRSVAPLPEATCLCQACV